MMNAIMGLARAKCDRLQYSSSALFAWILSVFILVLLTFSLPAEAGKPPDKGGGKPPGGSTQNLPMRLGLPAGCGGTDAYGFNDGALAGGHLVVVGLGRCPGATTKPVRWQNGAWSDVFSYPISGIATDASNNSPGQAGIATVVGWIAGADYFEFVQPPGSVPLRLPRLRGTTGVFGAGLFISDDGDYITGVVNVLPNGEEHGLRWSYESGVWRARSLGVNFIPRAISDDGSVIVGNVGEQVKLWVKLPAGGGELIALGSGFAEDISPTAAMVVGYRPEPCTGSCTWYPVPVYWVEAASGWVRHDLSALDGVDSEAKAVADVDGKRIIVGWGFTRKDAVQRAVAWIPDSAGNYGQPIRLDAIDGRSRSWAYAVDVNSHGTVLGNSSAGGSGREAVLWILPK